MKYYRTNKTTERVRKKTHIDRLNWIDNDGKGRTYSEISSPNSGYRKCLENDVSLEGSYHGNSSSVDQHLNYDEKRGWIKRTWTKNVHPIQLRYCGVDLQVNFLFTKVEKNNT